MTTALYDEAEELFARLLNGTGTGQDRDRANAILRGTPELAGLYVEQALVDAMLYRCLKDSPVYSMRHAFRMRWLVVAAGLAALLGGCILFFSHLSKTETMPRHVHGESASSRFMPAQPGRDAVSVPQKQASSSFQQDHVAADTAVSSTPKQESHAMKMQNAAKAAAVAVAVAAVTPPVATRAASAPVSTGVSTSTNLDSSVRGTGLAAGNVDSRIRGMGITWNHNLISTKFKGLVVMLK